MFSFRYVSRIWIWIFVIYLFFIFVMCYCDYRYINFIYKQVWRWGRVPKKNIGSQVGVGARICIFHLHNYTHTHTHIPYLNTLQALGVKLNTRPTPVITNRPHFHTWNGVGNFFICSINDCPHGQPSVLQLIDLNAWMVINPALIPARHWLIPCSCNIYIIPWVLGLGAGDA